MDTPQKPLKHLDMPSLATILITLVLFAIAVIVKGLTHDLLLEAAVFLVSVKLILMSYKNAAASERLHEQLDRIEYALKGRSSNDSSAN